MLKIRLSKVGSRNKPFYKIVVTESKKKLVSESLDNLGFVNPKTKEVKIDKEKLSAWVKKGAQKSPGLIKFLTK